MDEEQRLEHVVRLAYWVLYDVAHGLPWTETAGEDAMGEMELLLPSLADARVEHERPDDPDEPEED